jgi:ATP-binding cassette subfamily C protein CydC
LDRVSFSLREGQTLAIVGPSGAGKSSIANVLLGFWDYQEGQVRLGGHELRQYSPEQLHRMTAVVTQKTHLFNTTIKENLSIARPGASLEEIIHAARQAQIHDFIESLPQGYNTRIGEQGLNLSGGERQRLALARAILKDAPVLILDEPTANLDPETEREVLDAIHALAQNRTTIIITHRLVGLDRANEILVLKEGQVAERGTERQLLEREGLYWRMWQAQNQVRQTANEAIL